MTAVIIDDDAEFIEIFSKKLAEWSHEFAISMDISDIRILDNAEHVADVRRMLKYTKGFDVYFIDIKMPIVNGFELVDELQAIHKDADFVFVSAFESYMQEAFYSRPIAFIRKSYLEEDTRQLMRYWKRKGRWSASVTIPCESGGDWTVRADELVYCMSREHYVKFCFNDGRVVLQRVKLNDVEEVLKKQKFMRIHNRYIVNRKYIVRVTTDSVWVTNFGGDNRKYNLPISKSRKKEVERLLMAENI